MRRLAILAGFILILIISSIGAQTLPPIDPAQTTGNLSIAGSPALVTMTDNVATSFSLAGYQGTIEVEASDTAIALEQLCNGELDIALTNRLMSSQEANLCISNGAAPVAFRVATDAVVVAVARQNTFAIDVTSTELQALFGTTINWSDIRPEWPEQPIARFGPGQLSDEFALFATVLFGGDANRLATALGAQYNDDVNVSIQRVVESPTSIGFFDARQVLENTTLLTGVAIDGVIPNAASIADTSYPLARPLLLYTTTTAVNEHPQIADFLNFYLTNVEQEIPIAGLYRPPANALEAAVTLWSGITGGGLPTPEPQETPTGEIVDDIEVETSDGTDDGEEIEIAVVATPIPEPTVPPVVFPIEVQTLLVDARLDLELLANELRGASRPPGWSGSLDVSNPQLPLLLRLDLELLAATVYGADMRPDNWFGAVNSSQVAIARDIRHDLEVLADDSFAQIFRPPMWTGADPILRCDRQTQALVTLLRDGGLYTVTADPFSERFCATLAADVALFTEVNLLSRELDLAENGLRIPRDVTIDSDLAVAYYNLSGSRRAGLIPFGTDVTPLARSYNGFSNMTLIENDMFLVFVEYQNTTLSREVWLELPNVADLEYETFCNAGFC